jgi:nucleotide-binding universal stress UspA family protein
MILLNTVLVASDFGETSRAALDYGRTLSRAFGARLHVLHVVDAVVATSAAEFYGRDADLEAELVEEASRNLIPY